jgi:tocopherol O-methyltransferase
VRTGPLDDCVGQIAEYYEDKTNAIMRRYGPGPRVHYHTGLIDDARPVDSASTAELRRLLVLAQERTLCHAARVWDAASTLGGDVLDVGCGLGGGSIFWAQEFGARVTAITCVASHVDWVARFAAQAGVGSQVRPRLCDALAVPGEGCFDAAVAVDSSCHLSRKEWFPHLYKLLRPGGRVFIVDCFLGRPEYASSFDSYWHTRIGSIDEYVGAGRAAGFQQQLVEDLSRRTENFWKTTLALISAEAEECDADHVRIARRDASLHAHSLIRQGLSDRGLRYALISFAKPRN